GIKGDARAIATSGDYVYIADYQNGLQIIDASVPANPKVIGMLEGPRGNGIAVSGNYVYLVGSIRSINGVIVSRGGLYVIDVSNPANPKRTASIEYRFAYDVAISGHYVYAMAEGLRIVDIADPTNPKELGNYRETSDAQYVAISGNYAITTSPSWG